MKFIDFFRGVVEDAEAGVVARLAAVVLAGTIFIIPHFVDAFSLISLAEYSVLGFIFVSAMNLLIAWVIIFIVLFILFFIFYAFVWATHWVVTGKIYYHPTDFMVHIVIPFYFIFALLFCKSKTKDEAFKPADKKVKECLADE